MSNGITGLLVIVAFAIFWYSSDMVDEVDKRNELLSQAYGEVDKRNKLLTQAYTDIAQMTANQANFDRRMDVAIRAREEAKFYFYYMRPEQKYGVDGLKEHLQSRVWKEDLDDDFDCSKMSTYLERKLENEGYHTVIVGGESPDGTGRHAWLLVETSEGKYTPVEATARSIVDHHSPYFDNYFRYEFHFETIQEAVEYNPTDFEWWK